MKPLPAFRLALCTTAAALANLASLTAHAVGRLTDVQVIDRDSGETLTVYRHRGEHWVAGRPGTRYAVSVRNATPARVLGVISVDGLNVISGETAAWQLATCSRPGSIERFLCRAHRPPSPRGRDRRGRVPREAPATTAARGDAVALATRRCGTSLDAESDEGAALADTLAATPASVLCGGCSRASRRSPCLTHWPHCQRRSARPSCCRPKAGRAWPRSPRPLA